MCWPALAAPTMTSPGCDAGAVDEANAPARLELVVEGEGALDLRGGLDRPERIIFARRREPEDGDDRVADDLLDRPPCYSKTARISSKYRVRISRSVSGSSRSPSAVEP